LPLPDFSQINLNDNPASIGFLALTCVDGSDRRLVGDDFDVGHAVQQADASVL
jgi:hypothetical protein